MCCFFSQLQHLSSKGFVVLGLGGVLVFVDPRFSDPSGRGEGSGQEAKSCLSPADTSGGGQPHIRQRSTECHRRTSHPREPKPSVKENPNTGSIKQF